MRRFADSGYFHACTDGSALAWMFRDERDFVAGVNRIGICHLKTGVKVIAFVLMDNHVHFVLYASMLKCKEFITLYKQLTGIWIHVRYGLNDFLRHLPAEILLLDSEERLLNTIAYVDRNPVMAGYQFLATEYPWGSAKFMFKNVQSEGNDRSLSLISRREQRRLLGTRFVLPDEWAIDDNGLVSPLYFMDMSQTESFFRTPARYSYFLSKKLEGAVEQDFEHSLKTFVPDAELRVIVKRMVEEEYGEKEISALDVRARLAIARKLRYSYAAGIKQIARMVHLERSALEGFV